MQSFLMRLFMASFMTGCNLPDPVEGSDALNDSMPKPTESETETDSTNPPTGTATGTVPTSGTTSSSQPTSGTGESSQTTDTVTTGPVDSSTGTGTTGTMETTSTGTTSTNETGEPPCAPSTVTCQDLMDLGWTNDCVRYGDSPLLNMNIAEIAFSQVIELRYRNCPGQDAWEQLLFVLDSNPIQDNWQDSGRGNEAEKCATVELFQSLKSLEGVFAYPSPPVQPNQNFPPGAQDKAVLNFKLCGTDEKHALETLTVARKGAKGACTDKLQAGDKLDSVISVQLANESPYALFNQNGIAVTFLNQPIFDVDPLDGVNVPGTLRIKAGVSGDFCVVPMDDGSLNYVSAAPAPDITIN